MSDTNCARCSAEFPKPPATGGASGYGIDNNENKICYDCCTRDDMLLMQTEKVIIAYVDEVKRIITNWPGYELGKIIWTNKIITQNWFGGQLGTLLFINAIDPYGNIWYGKGLGNGMSIRLKKKKNKLDNKGFFIYHTLYPGFFNQNTIKERMK